MAKHILDQIFEARQKRVREAEAAWPLAELKHRAELRPPALDFALTLKKQAPCVIAEIKKGSPSKGIFKGPFDHVKLARSYAAGGAAALSVVTEPDFFAGQLEWLADIRQHVPLPVLRKDFVFCDYQVWESRAAGADAILLILAMLTLAEAERLMAQAHTAGLQCLLEVHDQREAEFACDLDAYLVGVNNRDLKTFEVKLDTSEQLAPLLPVGAVRVSESGISTQADCARLAACGFDAFLVGEALVTSADPAAQVRSLRGVRAAD